MVCKGQNKPLADCLIAMKEGETTNGRAHLRSKHKGALAEVETKRDEKKRKNAFASPLNSPKFGFNITSNKKSKFALATDESKKEACKELDDRIFKFVNHGAHTDSTVENKHFREVIDYCIKNGQRLQNYPHMGRRKIVTIQFKHFQDLIDKISKRVKDIRQWYVDNTGARRPFICVCSDVWDAKKMKLNGVSIITTDPETLEVLRIPVALTQPLGETAVKLSATNLMGLERVGVEEGDLFASCNDNCPTAVLAGKITVGWGQEADDTEDDDNAGALVEKKGRCDMHLASLAAKLALSFTKRTENGKVINYWAPFRDLYKKFHAMMSYLFDGKHKTRFRDYKAKLGEIHQNVISISLPNDTRIAGVHLLMKQGLRSCCALMYYASQDEKFKKKALSRMEWRLLAQFEAIIRAAMNFCFTLQGNRVEIAGEMILQLIALKAEYADDDANVYDVVDVDNVQEWEATTSFSQLPKKEMTVDQNAESK